jgi:hypothetical protein
VRKIGALAGIGDQSAKMPRPYQIGILPTLYRDAAAVQGNQGFGALRKLLTKVGLEVD